jgi:hypothetical protein
MKHKRILLVLFFACASVFSMFAMEVAHKQYMMKQSSFQLTKDAQTHYIQQIVQILRNNLLYESKRLKYPRLQKDQLQEAKTADDIETPKDESSRDNQILCLKLRRDILMALFIRNYCLLTPEDHLLFVLDGFLVNYSGRHVDPQGKRAIFKFEGETLSFERKIWSKLNRSYEYQLWQHALKQDIDRTEADNLYREITKLETDIKKLQPHRKHHSRRQHHRHQQITS